MLNWCDEHRVKGIIFNFNKYRLLCMNNKSRLSFHFNYSMMQCIMNSEQYSEKHMQMYFNNRATNTHDEHDVFSYIYFVYHFLIDRFQFIIKDTLMLCSQMFVLIVRSHLLNCMKLHINVTVSHVSISYKLKIQM